MPGRWARRISLTAAVAAAAFCASGTVAAGPIPDEGAGVCLPAPEDDLVAVTPWIPNPGPATVTITHLALRDPVGLTIEAAYLAPHHLDPGGGGLGFGFGPFPPSFDPEDGAPDLEEPWSRRVAAIGGQVPPGDVRSLVIGLRQTPDGQPGSLRGFDIAYTEGGRLHHVSMEWDILIPSDASACETWAAVE